MIQLSSARCRSALIGFVLIAALAAASAEDADPDPGQQQIPPPPKVDPQNAAAELLKALPQVPSIVVKDGQVLWQHGDKASFPIIAAQDHDSDPVINTPLGRITVTRALIADNRTDILDQLPNLVAQGTSAGLSGADLDLRVSFLTGVQLSWKQGVVLGEGVLRSTALPTLSRKDDLDRLTASASRLMSDLDHTDVDGLARTCLIDILTRIAGRDTPLPPGTIAPSMARRLIRGGWLRQFYAKQDGEDVARTEQAVVRAERFLPVTLFEGGGGQLRLAVVEDAFTREGWTLSTPTRCAYMMQHRIPLYYAAWPGGEQPGERSCPRPLLVVELPPGSDPTAIDAPPLAAQLHAYPDIGSAPEEIASWSKDKPMPASRDAWRHAIPSKERKDIDANATSDLMPPHILITALNGDIIQLVVAGGVLIPPRDGGAAETERFLSNAAKVLPDPAHLDLIGEYFLQDCHSSPDARYPGLIGTSTLWGDLQQTTAVTLATTTAGMFRGNHGDLAELYQAIAERQGRSAHIIALPGYAALAFAEKKDDGDWHTFVLRAGAPVEFADAKLPAALERAYKSFAEDDDFNPAALGLLLRLPGERTRTPVELSWRIFAEPGYAKSMIDVEADCHAHTYGRGVDAMQQLIAAGDKDSANYHELSRLFAATGQVDRAIENQQEALSRCNDPVTRLDFSVELVQRLLAAKQLGQARDATREILAVQLPALAQNGELSQRLPAIQTQLGVRLVQTLCQSGVCDLALRALKDTQLDALAAKIAQLCQWMDSPRYDAHVWASDSKLLQLRHQLDAFAGCTITLLRTCQAKALPGMLQDGDVQTAARSIGEWLDDIAFRDLATPAAAMQRYALVGRFYGYVLGDEQLLSKIDAVAFPVPGPYDHGKRLGGLAQIPLDLRWIKCSVPFWSQRLMGLFTPDHATLDTAEVARLNTRASQALTASISLGLASPSDRHQASMCAVIAALIGQDAKTLQDLLHQAGQSSDRTLRDDTAQWIGDSARFLDPAWFQNVLQLWRAEAHDATSVSFQDEGAIASSYLWIAWRAALAGAPRQAMMAADLATFEFKDNAAIGEEHDHLQRFTAAALAAATAAPAPTIPSTATAPAAPPPAAVAPPVPTPGQPAPAPSAHASPAPAPAPAPAAPARAPAPTPVPVPASATAPGPAPAPTPAPAPSVNAGAGHTT